MNIKKSVLSPARSTDEGALPNTFCASCSLRWRKEVVMRRFLWKMLLIPPQMLLLLEDGRLLISFMLWEVWIEIFFPTFEWGSHWMIDGCSILATFLLYSSKQRAVFWCFYGSSFFLLLCCFDRMSVSSLVVKDVLPKGSIPACFCSRFAKEMSGVWSPSFHFMLQQVRRLFFFLCELKR